MDTVSKAIRSWNMSRIGSCDTQPELAVRSLLHKLGYRFRLHARKLPGTPDIVLSRYRAVVLVHGCFWHRHKGCPWAYMPKTRESFWSKKFNANVSRDRAVKQELKRLGWRVIVVWECELEDVKKLSHRLSKTLQKGSTPHRL